MAGGQRAEVDRPAPAGVGHRLLRLSILTLLTFPIFAHGCHTGDHDDEPVFAPPQTAEVVDPDAPL